MHPVAPPAWPGRGGPRKDGSSPARRGQYGDVVRVTFCSHKRYVWFPNNTYQHYDLGKALQLRERVIRLFLKGFTDMRHGAAAKKCSTNRSSTKPGKTLY